MSASLTDAQTSPKFFIFILQSIKKEIICEMDERRRIFNLEYRRPRAHFRILLPFVSFRPHFGFVCFGLLFNCNLNSLFFFCCHIWLLWFATKFYLRFWIQKQHTFLISEKFTQKNPPYGTLTADFFPVIFNKSKRFNLKIIAKKWWGK